MNLLELFQQILWNEAESPPKVLFGVPAAAWAPAAASLFRQKSAPVTLIVAPGTEQAERLIHDVEILFDSLKTPPKVLLWPVPDLAKSADESSGRASRERLAVLDAAAHPSAEGLVIVASVNALAHTTLPPPDLVEGLGEIKLGDSIDRDVFADQLAESGYERVDEVETHGQFAVRGGIIDLFPPASRNALRIELFDVEVDSLRLFDPATQRSYEEIKRFRLTPPREEHINEKRGQEVAKKVRQLLDEQQRQLRKDGFMREAQGLEDATTRDLERLESGVHFAALRRYVGLLYPDQPTLLEHLPSSAMVIWADTDRASLQSQRLIDENKRLQQSQVKSGTAVQLPPGFCNLDQLREKSEAFETIELSISPPPQGQESTSELHSAPVLGGQAGDIVTWVQKWQKDGGIVVLSTAHGRRLREILADGDVRQVELIDMAPQAEAGQVLIFGERLWAGFVARFADKQKPPLAVLTDAELFGWQRVQQKLTRKKHKRAKKTQFGKSSRALGNIGELKVGDYVVHIQHGIARYGGVVRQEINGSENDYLLLEFAGNDRMYIAVNQLYRVQKYLGAGGVSPTLNSLHNKTWQRTRQRVREDTAEIAKQLAALYAARDKALKTPVTPDTAWQRELETAFPFEETPSQLQAIKDAKTDMETDKPMDRLVCGDVGFGKTEVAVRTAFKAVQAGLQVAVLVPTTVLAQQHYQTFSERMAPYPIRVESVSRFRTAGEQNRILEEARQGSVDIIIGTHRLLQKDVNFKRLGLVIVDEEQRFGVMQKERLKELRADIDLLTLSATPIPRTMHQAMGGLREISLITDPPSGRLPVRTYVQVYQEDAVRNAIEYELEREGQVYFVHNRVSSINHMAQRLRELLPHARIGVGHGQMADGELEQVMLDFMHRRTDILLATTIIENGLDLPNVNTLIVDHAERFGLSQMYQLRGRVGRSSRQAYAWFFRGSQGKIKANAQDRFSALQDNTDLGSGFKIAMRDLEIRGAGDLLGTKQSGNIEAVGFELYAQMLAEAVETQKTGKPVRPKQRDFVPVMDIPVSAYLPEDYIVSETERLEIYQRVSQITDSKQVREVRLELRDRFGLLPSAANNLLRVSVIRLNLQQAVLQGITHREGEVVIRLKKGDRFTDDDIQQAYAQLRKAADARTLLNISHRPNEGLIFASRALAESVLLRLLESATSALATVRGKRLLGIGE